MSFAGLSIAVRPQIVAYSALPLVGWTQQAFQAGTVACLQKPINLKLLMETIQEFILS